MTQLVSRGPLSRSRRRPRRRLLRLFGWTVFVLCLPPLAWLIWNRIDEAPNADALRWAAMPARTVADADNAWLYLYGIGAAEDEDPIAFGRQRTEAFLARARIDPQSLPGALEQEGAEALPQRWTEAVTDVSGLCQHRDTDCIAWAAGQRETLEALAEANRLRLQRYEAMLQLPQWQEPPLQGVEFPIPPVHVATLQANLLALDANAAERLLPVAEALVRKDAFWRRVAEQGNWLVSKIISFAFQERCQRLLAELYERAAPTQRAALQPAVDAVFAPSSVAAIDLDIAAYEHAQTSELLFRHGVPGIWRSLRNCVGGKASDSCATDLMLATTFLPQATVNLSASLDTAMAEFLAAPPADEAAAGQRYSEQVERAQPLQHSGWAMASLAYNASGKVLAVIAIPKANWRRRLNDHELLRRMLRIKLDAIRDGVAEAAMPAFVAAQPEGLRHPYPDKAIAWDVAQRALVAPTATEDSFKRDGLVVAYRAAPPAAAAPPALKAKPRRPTR